MWIVKLFADFFMALGFLVFFGALFVMYALDGSVKNVEPFWLLGPSLFFAYLRGELWHWPRELDHPTPPEDT